MYMISLLYFTRALAYTSSYRLHFDVELYVTTTKDAPVDKGLDVPESVLMNDVWSNALLRIAYEMAQTRTKRQVRLI